MNALPPIMLAHNSDFYFARLIPGLILWLILEAYMVIFGGYGVLKRSLKKRDAFRIGAVTIAFALASMAFFQWCGFLFLDFSLLYKLALIPGALGAATIIRSLLTDSDAELDAPSSGGPGKPLGNSGISEGRHR